MNGKKRNLTEGPIWKVILLFALPVFLSNVFQQLYNAFDAWCVGNFIDDNALAAVSSSGSLIHLLIGFFNGVALGSGVLIARSFGAKDQDAMEKAIHTAVAFGLVTGLALAFVGIVFTPFILEWMSTPREVLPQSISYFRCYFCGAIFMVMYNIFEGILLSVGDSRHPLYYLIISTLINIALDMLFVAGLGLGVGAAGIATTISQGVSALLCFQHLLRVKAPYRLRLRKIRFHKDTIAQIIRYGIPSGMQTSVISLANVVVQSNINSFGKAAMAGCGAYSKLEGFAFLPVNCFIIALSTFVGQNLGAKQYTRTKKGVAFSIACSCLTAEVLGLTFYLLAPRLIGLFTDSPESIAIGVRHMRTICLFYPLLAFSHCIAGTLRGAGKAIVPLFVMLGFWCALRMTYVTIAVKFIPQITTISWAYPLTWCCSSIVFLIYFFKADWVHNFDRESNHL